MSVGNNSKQSAVHMLALLHAHFNLSVKLVEKGILTQQEAAEAMIKTANDIRNGTEENGDEIAQIGELAASQFERYGGFILGIR